MEPNNIKFSILSLTVLGSLKRRGILCKLYELLESLDRNCFAFAQAYADFTVLVTEKGGMAKGITKELISDCNRFAQASCTQAFCDMDAALISAVDCDLKFIDGIFSQVSSEAILDLAVKRYTDMWDLIFAMPRFDTGDGIGIKHSEALYKFYRKHGYGEFAATHAYAYKNGGFVAIEAPDAISLSDLKGYDRQKQELVKNTLAFLEGSEACNVLLYGDKGTGKSSMIKAVVNEYIDSGLKLVEVKKESIGDFQDLLIKLGKSPFKFIVFLDDLSFVREDDRFNSLKGIIEGGVMVKPDNVIIYATSNLRHMVSERFSDRQGDELHVRDTIEALTSLADRFGLGIPFEVPDRSGYIEIVRALAREKGIKLGDEELELKAERFALARGGRSPRVARQFITSLIVQNR